MAMAISGMHGPYRLDPDTIDVMITRASPGTFALGTERGATFYVACVGRSDSDVATALKARVGSYVHFKFVYAESARAAFDKECELYHEFGLHAGHHGAHPARPQGSGWTCPGCEVFG
jgi:hypothetical protein